MERPEIEDPNRVAILIPSDGWTTEAFGDEHNKPRYVAPQEVEAAQASPSRESRPALHEGTSADGRRVSGHRLVLDLRAKTKNPCKGFAFGSDRDVCDVWLGSGQYGFSRVHFYLTFDTDDTGRSRLILKDTSTEGTSVQYHSRCRNEKRRHFTWVLDLPIAGSPRRVEVVVGSIRFQVKLASHLTCADEYDKNVESFLAEELTPDGAAIFLPTKPGSPSLGALPQGPIYIRDGYLGRGSFGDVERVVDVSTGISYARKKFFEPSWEPDKSCRVRKKAEWLRQIEREIRILKDNQQENIVAVTDHQLQPPPYLVMPYFPLGNLYTQHKTNALSRPDVLDLLQQTLVALRFLHGRGVAHRDLKPQNILVEARLPRLRVMLADFGLANDAIDMQTVCGTALYTAPEVVKRKPYTTAVDLWSVGVIMLECAYGLPSPELRPSRLEHGAWSRHLARHARLCPPDPLVDLVIIAMLRPKPEDRLSAAACLKRGRKMGFFRDH